MNEERMNWLVRMVRRFLRINCGQWKWARKLVGGRWEEWWVDSGVNAYLWLHEPRYLKGMNRPEGCAIWEFPPMPRRTEIHSANAESIHPESKP